MYFHSISSLSLFSSTDYSSRQKNLVEREKLPWILDEKREKMDGEKNTSFIYKGHISTLSCLFLLIDQEEENEYKPIQ